MSPIAGPSLPRTEPEGRHYASRTEVARILQLLANESIPVSAKIGAHHTFISHIREVDAVTGHFAVAYGANKAINALLFTQQEVEFSAGHRQGHLIFCATHPADTLLDGKPAIQFTLPQTISFYHRREHPRITIPEDRSLRCIADEGGIISFEARITDVSRDGMGGLLYAGDIELQPGMVLKGSRIVLPEGSAPVIADLEVRHITTLPLASGHALHRAGVRFLQRPPGFEELIERFRQDIRAA